MHRKLTNFSLLWLFISFMMTNSSHYVHGVGYQESDRHSEGSTNYNFEYGVDGGGVGPQFGHEEERNGHQTRGRYSVLLPDGRLQVVTYTADKNGYVADITYENGPGSSKSTGGHNNGYGYENVATSAISYGPPPTPPTRHNDNNNKGGGYSGKEFGNGSGKTFGKRNSRSFVKVRRTAYGKQFSYMY